MKLFLLALGLAWAQVAVPPLTGRVVDQTGTLTREQHAGLERTLQEFEARKGSQLAVLLEDRPQEARRRRHSRGRQG
jgi:uncharacterized protein